MVWSEESADSQLVLESAVILNTVISGPSVWSFVLNFDVHADGNVHECSWPSPVAIIIVLRGLA